MSEVENSHYVTRGLTRSWKAKGRQLHYFDLRTETLGKNPAKELFAIPGLHTTTTERTLNRLVEDSVGKYKQFCEKNGSIDPNDERMTRALIGLVGLQVQRAQEALAPEQSKYTLDDMLADEAGFNWLVDKLASDFHLVCCTIPRGEWMCFPSLGFFLLPVVDHPPAMAVPLTPRIFVTLFPREALLEHLRETVRTSCMVHTFSMLGGGLEHKLVLPAQIAENNDPASIIALVKSRREDGRTLFNLLGKASFVAGMRGFGYD